MNDTTSQDNWARRIREAQEILRSVGMPTQQQNERSALVLFALADLTPVDPWASASRPLRGVTPLMSFLREHYDRAYAPNTRETIRKLSIHQFLSGGLILMNPDDPQRAINSALTVYQLTPEFHALLQQFGTATWGSSLSEHHSLAPTLRERYAQYRMQQRIPVTLPDGSPVTLSAGGQNALIREVIEQFSSRFVPGGSVLYIGDADEKWAVFDRERLQSLGVSPNEHGKMPDVVLDDITRGWLVLIEAVSSHGPISPKRHGELTQLFGGASVGLVYVTAFMNRKTLKRYLAEISWETEVWVADTPEHLIHFNGERFLGPYSIPR